MADLDVLDPSLLLSDPSLSFSSALTSAPTANARLLPTPNGDQTRVVFLDDEYERVCSFLHKSISAALQDYEGVWSKRDANKRAYEALPLKGEAITLPVCRSATNQQHAWLIDTFFSRDPFMDCEALGDRKYTIVVRDPDTGIHKEQTVTAVDEAKAIRYLINYKWTYRLPMRDVLSAWAMEALQDGNLPALVKVIYDDRYYSRRIANRVTKTVDQRQPQPSAQSPLPESDTGETDAAGAPDDSEMEPAGMPPDEGTAPAPSPTTTTPTAATTASPTARQPVQIVNSPQFVKYQGETVRIVNVPGENFLKPFSACTIDESPWVSHFYSEPVYETHRKLAMGMRHEYGGYDFCTPDDQQPSADQISSVLYGTTPADDQPGRQASRSTKEVNKQREIDPLSTNVIHEVYFRWPILTEDESASSTPTIEWMECTGYYHHKAQKLLSCWLLPTWSGERPFVDFFMRQRPNSYSGTCAVEDVAPFQHYASHLFHLQVQNLVMRNISVFFVRKGSAAATSLRGRKLHPGMLVEFDDPEDVQAKPLGTPVDSGSVMQAISFLKSGAQEMSLVTQYDSGTADLARVAGAAFSQQQDLAKMQPQQVYDNFAQAVSRLALKWLQFTIQYAPEQHVPKFDNVSDAVIDNILHLPREMVMQGDFSIYPIATPRDETKQMESQRDQQLSMAIDKANQALIGMWGMIAKPDVPPPFKIIGLTAIDRTEKILGELISHTRHDASEYVIPQKMLMDQLHALYEMQQQIEQAQQQQQQQQGMQLGQPPSPGGPPPNGPQGPPPPSGPGGPPPPGGGSPPVKISVALKGNLSPEQEAAAAAAAGVPGPPMQQQQPLQPQPQTQPQPLPPQPPPQQALPPPPQQGAPPNVGLPVSTQPASSVVPIRPTGQPTIRQTPASPSRHRGR